MKISGGTFVKRNLTVDKTKFHRLYVTFNIQFGLHSRPIKCILLYYFHNSK